MLDITFKLVLSCANLNQKKFLVVLIADRYFMLAYVYSLHLTRHYFYSYALSSAVTMQT